MMRFVAVLGLIACGGDDDTADTTDDGNGNGNEATVSLADDVVPIMNAQCGFCHTRTDSPSPVAIENDVFLENADDLLDLVGTFIVAGDAGNSGLVGVLRQDIPVGAGPTVMPPPASGRPAMTEADIGVVETWIDEGAEDN